MIYLIMYMDSLVKHIPHYLAAERAQSLLDIFQAVLPWATFAPSPKSRKVCQWEHGCSDADSLVIELCRELSAKENVIVQGIFFNLYNDGHDYCPYHRDMYGTDVYTISLGATRDLLVKPDGAGSKGIKFTLQSGDMYHMDELLHKDHKHSIPKRKGIAEPRISIVFFTRKQ